MTVYDYLNRVVHEGSEDDCFAWIMSHAETLSDGRKLYRTWNDLDGYTYFDVGAVFHILTIWPWWIERPSFRK